MIMSRTGLVFAGILCLSQSGLAARDQHSERAAWQKLKNFRRNGYKNLNTRHTMAMLELGLSQDEVLAYQNEWMKANSDGKPLPALPTGLRPKPKADTSRLDNRTNRLVNAHVKNSVASAIRENQMKFTDDETHGRNQDVHRPIPTDEYLDAKQFFGKFRGRCVGEESQGFGSKKITVFHWHFKTRSDREKAQSGWKDHLIDSVTSRHDVSAFKAKIGKSKGGSLRPKKTPTAKPAPRATAPTSSVATSHAADDDGLLDDRKEALRAWKKKYYVKNGFKRCTDQQFVKFIGSSRCGTFKILKAFLKSKEADEIFSS